MNTTAITSLPVGARALEHATENTEGAPGASLHRTGRAGALARSPLLHKGALRNLPPAEQAAAVASQFEAIFVRQLLGKTASSLFGSGGGTAGQVYGDLLADSLAKQLTAGPGLGLGRMLERQLTPRHTTDAAADSTLQPSTPTNE